MRYRLLAFLLVSNLAYAEGARIGVEFESERDNRTGMVNNALTLAPGWQFAANNFISRVELLVEHNEDNKADSAGVRAHENKLFVRLRHSGDFTENIGYYIRGGLGRKFNSEGGGNYGYVEPGVKYKFGREWEGVVAIREVNAIDGARGQHVRKFIIGPNFNFDRYNELEFRYVKGSQDKDLRAWVIEYVHKY